MLVSSSVLGSGMNNVGASYLLARFDATPGLEMLKWVPGNVSFSIEQNDGRTTHGNHPNLRQRDGQEVVDNT